MGKLGQIASDNKIDIANPYDFNALLKAVEKQIRGY
jgi:hypothetical protein